MGWWLPVPLGRTPYYGRDRRGEWVGDYDVAVVVYPLRKGWRYVSLGSWQRSSGWGKRVLEVQLVPVGLSQISTKPCEQVGIWVRCLTRGCIARSVPLQLLCRKVVGGRLQVVGDRLRLIQLLLGILYRRLRLVCLLLRLLKRMLVLLLRLLKCLLVVLLRLLKRLLLLLLRLPKRLLVLLRLVQVGGRQRLLLLLVLDGRLLRVVLRGV